MESLANSLHCIVYVFCFYSAALNCLKHNLRALRLPGSNKFTTVGVNQFTVYDVLGKIRSGNYNVSDLRLIRLIMKEDLTPPKVTRTLAAALLFQHNNFHEVEYKFYFWCFDKIWGGFIDERQVMLMFFFLNQAQIPSLLQLFWHHVVKPYKSKVESKFNDFDIKFDEFKILMNEYSNLNLIVGTFYCV